MNKYEKNMYEFLKKYPGEWHSYSQDALTKKTAKSLKNKGLIELNDILSHPKGWSIL